MTIPVRHLVLAAVLALVVTPALRADDGDHLQFIRASAHNPGVGDTLWVTDARVFNPDAAEPMAIWLAFLPPGADNTTASEIMVDVGPRQAVALDDLVASLFGEAQAGAVRLRSSGAFLATSRTYNIGDGSSGTYGQFIPAVDAEAALSQGILLQAANDPDPSGFRTNVGFVNPTLEPCTVTFEVFDLVNATRLGSGTVTLPPLGFRQVNNVFQFVGAGDVVVRNASVELSAEPPVLAYASVVDNTSGDPIFVSPSADTGTPATANNPPEGTILSPAGDLTVDAGATVAFAGTASDPDGDPVSVLWDFGDGMTSTELEPGDHTYPEAGSFTVTFTATDENGLADPTPDSRTITVLGDNQPPDGIITQPTGDLTVPLGDPVTFAGTVSDPDGDQVTVLWDFGDGGSSTEVSPGNYTYAAAGTYSVTFTAADELGLADPTPDSRTITVLGDNQPPDGVITQPTGDLTVPLGDPVTFAGTASDPDGDQVTVLWDFGDGGSSSEVSPGTYTYAAAGTYSVTFTATDEHGLADPTPDSRMITVQAPNSAPDGLITEPAANVTISAGESVSFAGTVSDPDGDQVTVLWDFGDGITSTQLVPGPHTYTDAGTYSVTFTATDEHGLADPTPDSRVVTVNPAATTLTQIQSAVFTPQCVGCHGGSNASADLNLEAGQAHSNLVNVPATTQSGVRVVPFDPDSSVLVLFLEDGHRNLPQPDIQTIRDWISAGALDN